MRLESISQKPRHAFPEVRIPTHVSNDQPRGNPRSFASRGQVCRICLTAADRTLDHSLELIFAVAGFLENEWTTAQQRFLFDNHSLNS